MKALDTFERLVPQIKSCKHKDCLVCADQEADIKSVRKALVAYQNMAEVCRLIEKKWGRGNIESDSWLYGKLKGVLREAK